MVTFRISAEVTAHRQIVVTLPPEVPLGQAELEIHVASIANDKPKRPRTSLAQWAEANGEHWGDALSSEDVEGFTGRRY